MSSNLLTHLRAADMEYGGQVLFLGGGPPYGQTAMDVLAEYVGRRSLAIRELNHNHRPSTRPRHPNKQ